MLLCCNWFTGHVRGEAHVRRRVAARQEGIRRKSTQTTAGERRRAHQQTTGWENGVCSVEKKEHSVVRFPLFVFSVEQPPMEAVTRARPGHPLTPIAVEIGPGCEPTNDLRKLQGHTKSEGMQRGMTADVFTDTSSRHARHRRDHAPLSSLHLVHAYWTRTTGLCRRR